jgi:hypothetical protein
MHPEGPATGHLDTGFLGFPLSSSKCWDGSQIPSCYCMLLMQPSLSKFIKISPCSRAAKLVNFQIISTLSNESRLQRVDVNTAFGDLCIIKLDALYHKTRIHAWNTWMPSPLFYQKVELNLKWGRTYCVCLCGTLSSISKFFSFSCLRFHMELPLTRPHWTYKICPPPVSYAPVVSFWNYLEGTPTTAYYAMSEVSTEVWARELIVCSGCKRLLQSQLQLCDIRFFHP